MFEIRVSTRKNKKYDVYKYDKKTKKWSFHLSFGDNRYQQYKDSPGIGAYTHLDHLDPERRRRYYLRHGRTNDKNSARWFSHRFLWDDDKNTF